MPRKILMIDCADEYGLIARVTGVCFQHRLNIIKNNEFVDNQQGRFFMRTELEGEFDETKLLKELAEVLPKQNHMKLVDAGRKRIVVLATKEAHCLGDLLMKTYYGALDVEIAAIVANYDTLAPLAAKFEVPFHHVCHQGLDRSAHERAMLEIIASYQPEYLVLAKYMRVLTLSLSSSIPIRSSIFITPSCRPLSAPIPIVRRGSAG